MPEDELVLPLPAVLDLKAAGPLAAALLARRGADLVLDAGLVERVGGQCLQVLLAAQASWSESDQALSIENATPEFCAAMELFGAGSALSFTPKEQF
jgi:chemotaxis protein CheX